MKHPLPKRQWRHAYPSLRSFFDLTDVRLEDIADAVGITVQHMSNLVKGRRTPSLKLAVRLSEETKVPVEAMVAPAAPVEPERAAWR